MIYLAKYWRYAAIVAVLAGGWAYHRVQVNAAQRAGYAAAQADMTAQVAKANAATAALEKRQRDQSHKAAVAWESKRAQLESQVTGLLLKPRPAIRLCRDGAGGGQLPGPGSGASSFDGGPARRIDAVRVGNDIASAGVVLAAECERYRQQLSSLQEWVRASQSAGNPSPP